MVEIVLALICIACCIVLVWTVETSRRLRDRDCTCNDPALPWAWGDLQSLGCPVHDKEDDG